MKLVVGLGNPGSQYAHNRHNIGFMAADEIVRRHNFSPWRQKFQGQVSEGTIAGDKVLLLKPETYMNLSGQSVAAAARFHKIDLADIVVLHDELDLPPGRLRAKTGGGAGGHNGLKSIDQHLGNAYERVRLGIGHPGQKELVAGYVLHDFAKADQAWIDPLLTAVADALPLLLRGDEGGFMNKVSTTLTPPKAKKDKPAETAPKTAAPAQPATIIEDESPLAAAMRLAAEKFKSKGN